MTGSSRSIEKCFEEAEDSGLLLAASRGLKEFPRSADNYDLADVIKADLSHNRFFELPQEVMMFSMMETLTVSYNYLKGLPDLSHLTALGHIDISQNQLSVLPVHLCSLPLKILKASHNRLATLPSEIGHLTKLQLLNLACNELTALPTAIGELCNLRSLNVRKNQLVDLPDELSKLKNLESIDFSSNRITAIPPAFRLITTLIKLELSNNPLSSPPAQVCMKGRVHVFKYLSMAAQQQEKRWSIPSRPRVSPSTSGISSSIGVDIEKINHADNRHDVCEAVDAVDQRKSVKLSLPLPLEEKVEVAVHAQDEPLVLPQPVTPELVRDSQHVITEASNQERVGSGSTASPPPVKEKPRLPRKPDLAPRDDQDQDKVANLPLDKSRPLLQERRTSSEKPSPDDKRIDEIEARKQQLLKSKQEILKSKQRLEQIKSQSLPRETVSTSSDSSSTMMTASSSEGGIFDHVSKRNPLGTGRKLSQLSASSSEFTMKRCFDSAKEEFQQLERLREQIESRLGIKLPDDLPSSLSDGIVLCHLINKLSKNEIPVIHVPSSGVPKLTMPKCQMNVDAFLEASRRLGVPKADLCSAPDILEEKNPPKLCRTVHCLLVAVGEEQALPVAAARSSSPL